MGRVGYGPSWSCAEFVMDRDVQLPFHVLRVSVASAISESE